MQSLLTRPSLLGAIFAVLVGVGAYVYLSDGEPEVGPEIVRAPVLVARRHIDIRQEITASDVEVLRLPAEAVHPLALKDLADIEGQYAATEIQAGEQVLRPDITEKPAGGDLAQLIPSGSRAFAIPISDAMAAGGLIKPGDHIDVIGVFEERDGGRDAAVWVVQNAEVLVISRALLGGDQEAEAERPRSPTTITATVTVAISPIEAQRIAVAEQFGSVRIVVRRPEEPAGILSTEVDLTDVVGEPVGAAVNANLGE